jgi:hypothetical protein
MSFIGRCDPDINLDNKIYFCLLHNQGGRFKIISTIGHVLCVLLFTNEFMPSVLIAVLIFLRSQASSGFHRSMFQHCVTSTGCLIRLSLGDPASTTIKTAMKAVDPPHWLSVKRPISSSFSCIRSPKNICLHQTSLFTRIGTAFVPQLSAISHSLFASIDSDDTKLIALWPPHPTPPPRPPRLQLGGPPRLQGRLPPFPPLPKVIYSPLGHVGGAQCRVLARTMGSHTRLRESGEEREYG